MAMTQTDELGSVQKTLLLPLWGRAIETSKAHPLLVDHAAAQIVATINYDFSTIARNINPITRLAWIARSLHIDRTIRGFVDRHANATIVNLGCGLDTTFERVDNQHLCWYDLDLPDVIDLRKRFIPESARRHLIACSLLDDAWLHQLKTADPIFFVAAGVFYYLEESQLKPCFIKVADVFPGAEVLFDACSPRGLKLANEKVIKAGGMDESAMLKWGLRRAKDMESWDSRIVVISEYPLFRNMKGGLSFSEKWGTMLSDALRIMSMVHLRLGVARNLASK
jgi:O-methyltransferase involved in polyketide biosynthesis